MMIDLYTGWGTIVIEGRWVHRGSGQEVELDLEDDIQATESGPSEPANDGIGEVERFELDTPLVALTCIKTIDQLTPRTPNAPPPRTQVDSDMKEKIRFMVSLVREDIHVLFIKVDHIQIELHILRTP